MWGTESWGQMVWGGVTQVPLMHPVGWVIVVVALILAARLVRRSGSRLGLQGFAVATLVAVPLVAVAAQISVPFAFQNGTIADATQVNANFDAVVSESNAQDTRITGLEAGPALADCRWESTPSTGIGAAANGTCPGGNVVSGGCRLNTGVARLVRSAPIASDGDPFSTVTTWRCEYDATSQFDVFVLCCGS